MYSGVGYDKAAGASLLSCSNSSSVSLSKQGKVVSEFGDTVCWQGAHWGPTANWKALGYFPHAILLGASAVSVL